MLCNETSVMTSSAWFWGSKGLKLVLAPAAILLNLLLIRALAKCSRIHLHINLHYLLINLSVCSIVASGYLLVKGVYTVLLWASGRTCQLQITFSACKYQEAIFMCCKLAILGTMLSLSIERLYAILRTRTSHHYEDKPYLAIIALSLIWLFSFICTGILLVTVPAGLMPYCNALFIYDKRVTQGLSLVLLPLELTGVIIYVVIWFAVVRYWKPAFSINSTYTLNDRFQKRIIIAVTQAMLPSSLLHLICWTIILSVSTAQVYFSSFNSFSLLLSQYLFYILWLLHMVLHPIFILVNCGLIRYHFFIFYPQFPPAAKKSSLIGNESKISDEWCMKDGQQMKIKERYFDMLNDSWNVEHLKNKKSSAKKSSISHKYSKPTVCI